MSLSANVQLISCAAIVIAGVAPSAGITEALPTELLQGGALVTLSWTVYHMLTKTIPGHLAALQAQATAHELAQKTQREDFLKALREVINK